MKEVITVSKVERLAKVACFTVRTTVEPRPISQTPNVKSACEPSGPSGWTLSWMGCYSIEVISFSVKFAIYTSGWRGTLRVKYLAQEHNTVPWPGLKPGLFDPGSSALAVRQMRLSKLQGKEKLFRKQKLD